MAVRAALPPDGSGRAHQLVGRSAREATSVDEDGRIELAVVAVPGSPFR